MARRSGRGKFADGSGEFSQGEGGAERIVEEEAASHQAFPSSFMYSRSALREVRDVA